MTSSGRRIRGASPTTDIPDDRYGKRVACAVRFVANDADVVVTTPPASPDPSPKDAARFRVKRVKNVDDETHVVFPPKVDECMGSMPPKGEIALLRVCEVREIGFYIGDASWITFTVPERDLAKAKFDDARASVFIG